MKKCIFQIATVLLLVFMGYYGKAQSYDYNIDDSKIAMEGYSPVSYVDSQKMELGDKNYKSTYDNVSYYFTNSSQKVKFEKNPTTYIPQYGGWCAYAVSLGGKFRPDPSRFRVVDGKLYLFTKNLEGDFIQAWLKEGEEKLIAKADMNWKNLE